MSKIISRRDFLTNGLIVSGTLLAQACAPEPLKPSNILASLTPVPSITPGPTKTSEATSEPFPPIEATEWAVNPETGRTDFNEMFRYVGDWKVPIDPEIPENGFYASIKKRALGLQFDGL